MCDTSNPANPVCTNSPPKAPTITGQSLGTAQDPAATVTYEPDATGPAPTDYKVYVLPSTDPAPNPSTTAGGIPVGPPAPASPITTDITSKLTPPPASLEYTIYVFAHNDAGFSPPATRALKLEVSRPRPFGFALRLCSLLSRAGLHDAGLWPQG